jgi:hypothetical protein
MSQKKYKVTLTREDEDILHDIMNRGKHGAQERKQAQALLLANEGYTDGQIADRAGTRCRAIEGLRQWFVENGFETTLEGKERGYRPCSLQGANEARLITLACSPAPGGP